MGLVTNKELCQVIWGIIIKHFMHKYAFIVRERERGGGGGGGSTYCYKLACKTKNTHIFGIHVVTASHSCFITKNKKNSKTKQKQNNNNNKANKTNKKNQGLLRTGS